jgi:hypothetical protein
MNLTSIDFSQRPKFLDLKDDHPEMKTRLEIEELVQALKNLDPCNWDPLPVNVKLDSRLYLIFSDFLS